MQKQEIARNIQKGELFIYPTDTIYGIGCDATNSKSVRKLRKLKQSKKPFSVIASKSWIKQNCVTQNREQYLKKLPGKYTLIFKLKNKQAVCKETNLSNRTIGTRIPKHTFTKIILKEEVPFITTSANISGKPYATCIKEIPDRIKKSCIIIDYGELQAKPSQIIDLTGKQARILR